MSEDQIKILVQILSVLQFRLPEAKIVLPILEYLQKQIKEPDVAVPVVVITPENINIKITEIKK